jgi:photosystem II stability/assembly factor-like uncharacterized protein
MASQTLPFALAAPAVAVVLAVALPQTQARKPAPRKPAARAGWLNVTRNLAPGKWLRGGITYLTAVPGKNAFVAGVAGRGLWKSVNGGVTWTEMGDRGQITFRPVHITFDPKNPDVFWTTGNMGDGIFKTTNGGLTFEKLTDRAGDCICVDFSDAERRTLLTSDYLKTNALYVSVSGGRSWHSLADSIPPGCEFQSRACFAADGAILAFSSGARKGIYRSKDLGRTWIQVSSYAPDLSFQPRFGRDNAIYWAGEGFLLVSHDDGKTWTRKPAPISTAPVILPDGQLVASRKNQMVVSRNDGDTWTALGPPIPIDANRGIAYNEASKAFMAAEGSGSWNPNDTNRRDNLIYRWP